MKSICPYSGITFTIQYGPASYSFPHPLFFIPRKRLLSYAPRINATNPDPIENRLLFLSLLHSTELVTFKEQVYISESAILGALDSLVALASFLEYNPNKASHIIFPHLNATASLDTNILPFIQSCLSCITSRQISEYERYGLTKTYKESQLLKRSQTFFSSRPDRQAKALARWASKVFSFPATTFPSLSSSIPISLRDYWIAMIEDSYRDATYLQKYSLLDYCELLEYIEEYTLTDAFLSSGHRTLCDHLRATIAKHKTYYTALGLDASLLFSLPTKLLGPSGNTLGAKEQEEKENAAISALQASAPSEKPIRAAYKSELDFLRAMNAWKSTASLKNKEE